MVRAPLLLFVIAAASAAHAQRAPHDPAPGGIAEQYIGDGEAIAAGKELYLSVCSGCHGVNGEGGRGPNLITHRNVRRASPENLFDAIKNGIPGTDMPPSPLPDEQVWQMTAFVRNLSAPAAQQSVPGDPHAGRDIYFGKGRCNECHTIRGEGGHLGPDFTNIGMTRNYAQLREGLLEPSLRIAPDFRPVIVTFQTGKTVKGVAKNNSNYSLQLLDWDGKLRLIDKRDLDKAEFLAESWMPGDYQEKLSDKEIEDLLAFVSQQTLRPAAQPARKRKSQ